MIIDPLIMDDEGNIHFDVCYHFKGNAEFIQSLLTDLAREAIELRTLLNSELFLNFLKWRENEDSETAGNP